MSEGLTCWNLALTAGLTIFLGYSRYVFVYVWYIGSKFTLFDRYPQHTCWRQETFSAYLPIDILHCGPHHTVYGGVTGWLYWYNYGEINHTSGRIEHCICFVYLHISSVFLFISQAYLKLNHVHIGESFMSPMYYLCFDIAIPNCRKCAATITKLKW